MFRLSIFLTAIAITSAKPFTLTTHHANRLKEIIGDINVTAVQLIIADEAEALGISGEKHWATCFSDDESLHLSDEESTEIAEEIMEKSEEISFKNKEEIMSVLKEKLPKTYAGLLRFVGENFAAYDNAVGEVENADGRAFLMNIKTTALEAMVDYSAHKDKPIKLMKIMAKAISKITDEWDSLSKGAKNAIERKICLQTAIRLLDQVEGDKGQMAQMKQQLNIFLGMTALLDDESKKRK